MEVTVLPEQLCPRARCGARESSAHRLMLGILEDAVHLYANQRGRLSRQQRELSDWFASPDRRWLYSFERICEALDFDADTLRRRLGVVADRDGDFFARIRSSVSGGEIPERSGGVSDRAPAPS